MGNGASIINAHEGPYSAKRVFTFQPGWGVQMPSQMEEVEGKMYMPLAPGALVGCGHSPTPIDLKFFKQLSFFCKTLQLYWIESKLWRRILRIIL